MISLLVSLLIVGLVIYLLFWFIDNVLALPANMNQAAKVVVSVLGLIWVLYKVMPILNF